MKAIFLKDVMVGDVVCAKKKELHTISQFSFFGDEGIIALYEEGKTGMVLHGEPDDVIGLVHRPRPNGKT